MKNKICVDLKYFDKFKDDLQKYGYKDVEEDNIILVDDCYNKIFSNYIFIKDEYIVKNIGKIDILAKDKISGRDVIIEIKRDKNNSNKQLLAYAEGFDNPILIGITNMNKEYYLKNVIYYSLDILNLGEDK